VKNKPKDLTAQDTRNSPTLQRLKLLLLEIHSYHRRPNLLGSDQLLQKLRTRADGMLCTLMVRAKATVKQAPLQGSVSGGVGMTLGMCKQTI